MKKYVCSVCGYVHNGELPDDFVCPLCGAGRDAFRLVEEKTEQVVLDKPDVDKELSAMEMSVICSNLARGCEKQYMPKESQAFRELAEFFKSKAVKTDVPNGDVSSLIDGDLNVGFPYANQQANDKKDRGAKRTLVWSEKVTNMLKSLLSRYETEGEKMLENTGVYVCTICGFVYVGNDAPNLCPVCKVPSWKFEKVERRAN